MIICVDLDGTLCETKKPGQSYADVKPLEGAVENMQYFRESGHYLIIYTARHMKTCGGNVGRILALQGKTLFNWLDKHKIPYDEVVFGKPLADVYIDDKASKFETWKQTNNNGKTKFRKHKPLRIKKCS